MKAHKNVKGLRWPIPDDQFRSLRQAFLTELQREGVTAEQLMPGNDFQPAHLRFGSRPKSDFLWPDSGSQIVSAKTKRVFEEAGVVGVRFCPAVIDKVGKRDSVGPAPIPESGEPEDIVEDAEPEQYTKRFGPIYEMVIVAESGRPPGAEITSKCEACGREEYDDSKRRFALTPSMVPSSDIFYMATTLYIFVNQKVRDLILHHRFTNVAVSECQVEY